MGQIEAKQLLCLFNGHQWQPCLITSGWPRDGETCFTNGKHCSVCGKVEEVENLYQTLQRMSGSYNTCPAELRGIRGPA